ncbi:sterol O-acyltransferase 1-like [Zophobas morio]|uniref:sterol O-acyltransferase 1-like n=1 Tax=Zophobas morio TaxID=2755281 RepID=UPI0030835B72
MNSSNKKHKTKSFQLRNSLLTDIFEDVRTRNVYNVYIIIFITLFIQTAAKEYANTQRVTFGLEVMKTGFTRLDKALLIWLCCFVSACVSYFVFKVWALVRSLVRETLIVDWLGGTTLVFYYFYSFKFVHNAVFYFRFYPACIMFVNMEAIRLLMKVHSFIRNSATTPPPALKFSNFLYFLFAPTLIYRDNYPRTATINWKFVVQRLVECISMVFILAFIIINMYPTPDRWRKKFTISETLLLILENMPYGALILGSFCILIFHSVQNLFAELTRFGDRLFYLDWWNSCNFSTALARWNRLVQDWLYYYVYCDFKEYVWGNKSAGKVMVFLVSFVVHEWVAFCCVGGFMPFMYVVFMVLVLPQTFFQAPKGMIFNVFFWCGTMFLCTCNFVLYSFELYAQLHDPVENQTWGQVFVPRVFTSDCVIRG